MKAFLTSRAAPADNAAPHYERGLAPLSGDLGEQGAALEQQIRSVADVEKLASGAVSVQHVEPVLVAAADAIKLIDSAQAKAQCIFVTGLGADALLPHAQASRSLARLSVLQLFHARSTGNFGVGESAMRRCLRLSRDLRPRGHFVCQLVSIANDGLLFTAIERVTLSDPKLTPEQCDRLLALLIEHEKQGLDRFDEGMRMDYIMASSSIDDLRTGRLTLGQIYEFQGVSPPDILLDRVAINCDTEAAACNWLYALALEVAGKSVSNGGELDEFHAAMAKLKRDWEAFSEKVKKTPPAQRAAMVGQMPAMQFHLWASWVEPARDATRRAATNLAGLQMLVALRRYELAHGKLPSTLDAAAAETALKTTPTDPYSGQPLRFATVAGRPTIYSVGKDLKDDGGQADWKFGQQPGDYLFVLPPR